MISVFKDYYKISLPSQEDLSILKDNIFNNQIQAKRGLDVSIEATHAGIFNHNRKFYVPSRMRDGVSTFLPKNGKKIKILKHHDGASDPVGVILGAEYIPTVPPSLENDINIKILNDSAYPINKQVAAAKNLLKSGIPFTDEWKGLGYVNLSARIYDLETIEQILDGRFDAVSTSFASPGEAYCSICSSNWAKDGLCEHVLGENYSDEDETKSVCCLIPGVHIYKECSLVVNGADPFTTIKISDSLNKDSIENVKEFNINFDDIDKHEKNIFIFKDFEEDVMNLTDSQIFVLNIVKQIRPELPEDKAIEVAKEIDSKRMEDNKFPFQVEAELSDEMAIQYLVDELETKDQEINADEVYAEMEKELDEISLSDAKLSTEKRNSLSSSTFCGPNRSFPVPDCAHVTAARRLIGRYKGPGSKSSILACVSRKAKALGCGGDSCNISELETKDSEVKKFEMIDCESLKLADNKDVQALFAMTEVELIGRKLKVERECSKCSDSLNRAETAEKQFEDMKHNLEEKELIFKVLRNELKDQYSDYTHLVDELNLVKTQLFTERVEKLAVMAVVSNKYKSLEEAREAISKDVNKQEAIICDSFSLDKVVEKMNDGLSREPKEVVENPICSDADTGEINVLSKIKTDPAVKAAINNIQQHIKDGKNRQAKLIYDKIKSLRMIDANSITFDLLVSDVKENLGGK